MNTPTEPSADMRALAHTLREMHVALVAEGFSEAQALRIVGTSFGTALGTATPKPDD